MFSMSKIGKKCGDLVQASAVAGSSRVQQSWRVYRALFCSGSSEFYVSLCSVWQLNQTITIGQTFSICGELSKSHTWLLYLLPKGLKMGQRDSKIHHLFLRQDLSLNLKVLQQAHYPLFTGSPKILTSTLISIFLFVLSATQIFIFIHT